VISDRLRSIVVCNDKEYAEALEANREPDGIGFPQEAEAEWGGPVGPGVVSVAVTRQVQ
jgi:hypothetical protein